MSNCVFVIPNPCLDADRNLSVKIGLNDNFDVEETQHNKGKGKPKIKKLRLKKKFQEQKHLYWHLSFKKASWPDVSSLKGSHFDFSTFLANLLAFILCGIASFSTHVSHLLIRSQAWNLQETQKHTSVTGKLARLRCTNIRTTDGVGGFYEASQHFFHTKPFFAEARTWPRPLHLITTSNSMCWSFVQLRAAHFTLWSYGCSLMTTIPYDPGILDPTWTTTRDISHSRVVRMNRWLV